MKSSTAHALFEEQARRTPDAVAVEDEVTRLTYAELDARAERIAAWITERGIEPEARVAIELPRSVDLLAAVLGVLKTGAAYVPLDARLPEERRTYMREDARCALTLSSTNIDEALRGSARDPRLRRPRPGDLAYVLYTSGSTGQPKGVMVEHRSIANLVRAMMRDPGASAEDVVLFLTTLTFDVSVAEIFVPLSVGARMIVASDDAARDPRLLSQLIGRSGANVIGATPTSWRMLVGDGWRPSPGMSLHTAGEALPRDIADDLLVNGARLFNLYGPTEATVYATGTEVRRGEAITIGRAIDGLTTYVLDDDLQPVATGALGQLFIGGEGVARGYFGRPALTAEKFVPDPFGDRPGARMYATGDVVKVLENGTLDYRGRIDHQVKLRGLRIELGEIEVAIRAQPSVRQAVVALDDIGSKRLVAYVVPEHGAELDVERLRAAVGRVLPEYMVPSLFMVVPSLATTASGKIDRNALPALAVTVRNEHVAPRDGAERTVAGMVREVLRVDDVGALDDFFELGGDCISAVRLVHAIEQHFHVRLPVRGVFEARSVRALAAAIASSGATVLSPIARVDRSRRLPVTSSEARLWFLHQLEPSAPTYNELDALRIEGRVDRAAFERAVTRLGQRHDAFRTRYVSDEGTPARVVDASCASEVIHVTARDEAEAITRFVELTRRPYDLSAGALVRPILVALDDGASVAVFAMHHIVTDAASFGVLFGELADLYDEEVGGIAKERPPHGLDFADWAASAESSPREESIEHFTRRLAHVEPIELPTDHPRASERAVEGRQKRVALPRELHQRVQALANAERGTVATALLAAYAALLHRRSGTERFAVAVPVGGRPRPDLDSVVGFFVNTVAIDFDFSRPLTVRELVRHTRDALVDAQVNADAPYDRVVSAVVTTTRDASRPPLCQVGFSSQPAHQPPRFGGFDARWLDVDAHVAKLELTLDMFERADGTLLAFEYATALFDEETVDRFARQFLTIADAACRTPDATIDELSWVPEDEQRRIVREWNATERSFDDRPVTAQIEEQARVRAGALAVADEHTRVTYAELEARATSLAKRLVRAGIQPDDYVAVWLPRSTQMVVAALAAMKSGAAYLPIDVTLPHERVAHMLADARVKAVIADRRRRAEVDAALGAVFVDIDEPIDTHARAVLALPRPRQAAYVIYTSGTTGRPKGTVLEHRSLANLVSEHIRLTELSSADRVTQIASAGFDATTSEIWPTLCAGAELHIVSDDVRLAPRDLVAFLRERAITLTDIPTPLVPTLLEEDWRGTAVRMITTGGDVLTKRPSSEHAFALVNVYGPTETTNYVTTEHVAAGSEAITTIGRPIQNTRVFIVDDDLALVPIGVYGEICIGGENVGRGYLARPELTADRFVPEPFSGAAGARMYRTGDRGRFLGDGRIQFAGRADDQVKVRGFRIELAEVAAALRTVESVGDVGVIAVGAAGGKRLVAYVVSRDAHGLDVTAVERELRRTLPDYMIPSAFVELPTLPMTKNGKLDRKALPAPDFRRARPYAPPRNEIERVVTTAWADILGVAQVGIDDDFFELGGHSLLAIRVVQRIEARTGVRLPLKTFLESRCPGAVAEVVGGSSLRTDVRPIARADRTKPLPVTTQEARLWFIHQLAPTVPTYNEAIAVRIEAPIDLVALDRAVARLTERHDALRTRFSIDAEGRPTRIVEQSVSPRRVHFSGREEEALARVVAFTREPYDLAAAPLWRLATASLEDGSTVVAFAMHHIVTDGTSSRLLVDDLSRLYDEVIAGASPSPPRAFDFADWAASEDAKPRDASVEHFVSRLRDVEPIALSTDRPRPPRWSADGRRTTFAMPPSLHARLRALASSEGASVVTAALTAYAALLHRHSGTTRFAIAVPVGGRPRMELEGVVGFLVNTVAVDFDFSQRLTLRDLLRRTRDALVDAQAHADAPYDRVVAALVRGRDESRPPLCQVGFAAQPPDLRPLHFAGTVARWVHIDTGVTKLELTLDVFEQADGTALTLEYATALFDEETIARFAEQFFVIADAACRTPDAVVSELPCIPADERRRLVREWSSRRAAPDERPVLVRIEAHARKTPDAVAVVDDRTELTYAELDARSERIAAWLTERGAVREARVAIVLPRSVDLVAAVLGVAKAGAAYVPIDPKLPEDRRAFMKSDAGCALELSAATIDEALRGSRAAVQLRRPEPCDLAYVLYTSGSTGRPKGVMVEHRQVANLVHAMIRDPGARAEDVALFLTTLSFDVSVAEMLVPLAVGARIVVASEDTARDPRLLSRLIAASGANVAGATPATWRMLTADGWRPPAGMHVHTAGEALPRDLADLLLENGARLFNLYGPTEATVYATGIEVRRGDVITIGRAIDGLSTYVLDDALEPVPTGALGQLFIGGAGVARGYLGRPALTAEKFVPDPFAGRPGARMYATGDLARIRHDGTIDYAGRIDHQVKVRGFRIELGEIEVALRSIPPVRQAAVIAADDATGTKRLVAYLVPHAGANIDVEAIRAALAKVLPEYMVPTVITTLAELPMTGTGKLDRKALPAPTIASDRPYVAPRTPLEEQIVAIWRSLLGMERVGITDDFFALGGHSLSATQLASQLQKQFEVEIPVRTIFDAPTIIQLAEHVLELQLASMSDDDLSGLLS